MTSERLKKEIRKLRESLDAQRYWRLCGGAATLRDFVALREADALARTWPILRNASDSQKTLSLLFFFGQEVSREALNGVVDPATCSALVELQILQEPRLGFQANSCSILTMNGCYLVAPQMLFPRADCSLYLGADSLRLVDALAHHAPTTEVFEVGAGTAVVGLGHQGRYTATEIDPWCAVVAWANCQLNGVEERCTVHCADLFESCPPTAETLVCNPPYLPVPDDAAMPPFAPGGKDGLDFVRRLLAEFPERLGERGRAVFSLQTYGNEDRPLLEGLLKPLAADRNVEIHYLRRSRVRRQAFEALTRGSGEHPDRLDRFVRHYEALGLTHEFDTVVFVGPAGSGGWQVDRYFSDWDDDSVPRPVEGLAGPEADGAPANVRRVLDCADGRRTVRQLAACFAEPGAGVDYMSEVLISWCARLEAVGALEEVLQEKPSEKPGTAPRSHDDTPRIAEPVEERQ